MSDAQDSATITRLWSAAGLTLLWTTRLDAPLGGAFRIRATAPV